VSIDTLTSSGADSPNPSSRDRIRTVTSGTFEELVLNAGGPVVAEFMSYGCTHCRAIEPILQQVAGMVEAKETIFRVNVAVERQLASRYRIKGTPTFVMFLNGNEVGRVEGPRPKVPIVLAALTKAFESSA
jgi:thioredoxin 1